MTLMPSEYSSDVKFEIGHVLFIDIVGYFKRRGHSLSIQRAFPVFYRGELIGNYRKIFALTV